MRELPAGAGGGQPRARRAQRLFPPTRAFAREIIPGVRETPATIEASLPWIAQTRALIGPASCGPGRRAATGGERLAAFVDGQIELLPQARPVQSLALRGAPHQERQSGRQPVDRAAQLRGVLPDAGLTHRRVAELRRQRQLRALPGRRRRLPDADADGRRSPLFANATEPPLGTRPAKGPKPPTSPTSLSSQSVPDLNSRQDRGRPMMRQIKKQAPVFISIVVLFALALGVGGYILSNQRFYLPAWLPVLGTDFYEVDAELQTAQAVVPGQGQTVNIAGVKVGEVGKVTLEDGHAVVQMRIKDSTSRSTRTPPSCCARRPASRTCTCRSIQAPRLPARSTRAAACPCPTRSPTSTPTRSWRSSTPIRAPTSACYSTPGAGLR